MPSSCSKPGISRFFPKLSAILVTLALVQVASAFAQTPAQDVPVGGDYVIAAGSMSWDPPLVRYGISFQFQGSTFRADVTVNCSTRTRIEANGRWVGKRVVQTPPDAAQWRAVYPGTRIASELDLACSLAGVGTNPTARAPNVSLQAPQAPSAVSPPLVRANPQPSVDHERKRVLLERLHPGWEQLVRTPEFNAWLGEQPASVRDLTTSPRVEDTAYLLDLFKTAKGDPSHVAVPPQQPSSSGTGFFVNDRGDLISNHHVVQGCNRIAVVLHDSRRVPARVSAVDASADLALVKVQGVSRPGLPIATSEAMLAEPVAVLGYPLVGVLGEDLRVTAGVISSLGGVQGDRRYLQISAAVQPGNSGGPLLDSSGNVVAVVAAKLAAKYKAENVNFGVKAPLVRALLDINSIPYQQGGPGKPVPLAEVVSKSRASVAVVECY